MCFLFIRICLICLFVQICRLHICKRPNEQKTTHLQLVAKTCTFNIDTLSRWRQYTMFIAQSHSSVYFALISSICFSILCMYVHVMFQCVERRLLALNISVCVCYWNIAIVTVIWLDRQCTVLFCMLLLYSILVYSFSFHYVYIAEMNKIRTVSALVWRDSSFCGWSDFVKTILQNVLLMFLR